MVLGEKGILEIHGHEQQLAELIDTNHRESDFKNAVCTSLVRTHPGGVATGVSQDTHGSLTHSTGSVRVSAYAAFNNTSHPHSRGNVLSPCFLFTLKEEKPKIRSRQEK